MTYHPTTRADQVRYVWAMFSLLAGGVMALSLIILFVPEPYADWLKQWSALGYIAAALVSMSNPRPSWPWVALFGPHITCTFALVWGWDKWNLIRLARRAP